MRIDFDFLDLEAFLAVKDTGSFQLAADRLNMSQSSATRRVRKLEAALGTELFVRTTRSVRPTLAAKSFQLRAEAIVSEAREATDALRDESAAYAFQRLNTITLATIPTLIADLVAPALESFQESERQARVRLLDCAANDVADAVAQGEADFGLCSIPIHDSEIVFQHMFNEPIVLAIPAVHRFSSCDAVSWRDLGDEKLILPARGTGNRLLIDEALAKNRVPIRWTYEVGRSSSALELVSKSLGVVPLPKMSIHGQRPQGVGWLQLSDPLVSRPIGMITRVGASDVPTVRALKAVLRDAGEKLGHSLTTF